MRVIRTAALALAFALFALPAAADEIAWRRAIAAGEAAYRIGDYSEASFAFGTALKAAEAFGESDTRLATSLGWLAETYRLQGRLAEAEPLLKRGLAIRERLLGPSHPSTHLTRHNLAVLQKTLAEGPATVPKPAPTPSARQAELAPLKKEPARAEDIAISRLPDPAQAIVIDKPKPASPPPAPVVVEKPKPAPVVVEAPKPVSQVVETKPEPKPVPPPVVVDIKPEPKPVPPPAPVIVDALKLAPAPFIVEAQKPAPPPPAPVVEQKPASLPPLAFEAPKPKPAVPKPEEPGIQQFFGRLFTPPAPEPEPKPAPSPPAPVVAEKPKPAPPSPPPPAAPAIVAAPKPAPVVVEKPKPAALAPESKPQDAGVAGLFGSFFSTPAPAPEPPPNPASIVQAAATLAPAPTAAPAQKPEPPRSRFAQPVSLSSGPARAFETMQAVRAPRGQVAVPLSLAAAQAALGPDEAMLSFLIDEQGGFLVALRRERAELHALGTGSTQLAADVKRLRTQLDPRSDFGARGQAPTFAVDVAHRLYRTLLGPAESLIRDAAHLIIVPHDSLQSLPFAVLVTEAQAPPPDLLKATWLAKRHALSVLPEESSLQALRGVPRASAARKSFVGFGDPVLPAPGLARLPETRYVLNAMADILDAAPGDVHVEEGATETAVKRTNLADFRVLAFATHGLMTGGPRGNAGPTLVLTPPRVGSAFDDGMLTAGEVARLKLDADLVVLSAASSAAADGTPDAEGMPRLAGAFLQAGSRSLMVSHWAVSADSTLKLVSRTLRERARGAGDAEALRRAMLALMNGEDQRAYTHPMYWAPFVVIGEGARSQPAAAARR